MNDEKKISGMSQDDLWGIADDVEGLSEWEPTEEPPAEVLADPEWVRSRLLALRFVVGEIGREAGAYDAEIQRLETQRDEVLGQLGKQDSRLRSQLYSYLHAVRADAEAHGRKPPASVKFPHGAIRSGGGSVRVVVEDEEAALVWCRENQPDAVKVKETILVGVLKSRMKVAEDCLVDQLTGEIVPGVVLVESDRWVKVDIPEST